MTHDAHDGVSAVTRRGLIAGAVSITVASIVSAPAAEIMVRASAGDMPVRRSQVRTNGVALNVIEQGEGRPVLFCHGFPDTSASWRRQMKAVADAGYRALALDMRGFGRSSAPTDPALYTTPHIVGDLVGLVEAMGLPPVVLVGHDWGANMGWQAAMMRPDLFPAMLGVSVPFAPRGDVSLLDSFRAKGMVDRLYVTDLARPDADRRFADAGASIPSILYWLSATPPARTRWSPIDPARGMLRPSPVAVPSWADPDYVAHLIAEFTRTGFDGGLNYYRTVQQSFNLTAPFRGQVIRQPTFYVNGKADGLNDMMNPTTAELRSGLPGLVGHVELEGVGHWVQHEAPDRLNRALLGFLATIDRR